MDKRDGYQKKSPVPRGNRALRISLIGRLAAKLFGALSFGSVLTLEVLVLSPTIVHDLIVGTAGEAQECQTSQAEEDTLD